MLDLINFIDGKMRQVNGNEDLREDIHKLILLKKVALYLMEQDMSSKVEDIVQIEDEETGYSEYRIINDCESDDRSLWMEYRQGTFRLNPGDLLIKMK